MQKKACINVKTYLGSVEVFEHEFRRLLLDFALHSLGRGCWRGEDFLSLFDGLLQVLVELFLGGRHVRGISLVVQIGSGH